METIIFLFALFTVSLGNAVPRHPNEDLIAKVVQPQHPNEDLINQAEQQNLNGRILGGESVTDNTEFPWQASLRTARGFSDCGAVIINKDWLVTAGHCVRSSGSVRVGSVDRTNGGIIRSISSFIRHEDYFNGQGTFANDIAVIKVRKSMPISASIAPVNLPTSNDTFAGNANCWITGWGRDSNNALPSILQKAHVNVYTNTFCNETWGGGIYDGHVCVGDNINNRGSCNGDSGSPLVCKNENGDYVLVGVTSWGGVLCPTDHPSVYSRISYFRNWIENNIH